MKINISPEKSPKKDVVRAIGLKSQDDCDLIVLQIIHIDSSPVSTNDDKRDYEKHIDAMAVEQIHQSTLPSRIPYFYSLPPTSLRHSSKCSSVHWTAVSNQSTLHFIFSLFLRPLCDSMRFADLQMKSFDLAKSFCPSSSRSGCMTSSANGSN